MKIKAYFYKNGQEEEYIFKECHLTVHYLGIPQTKLF